MKKRLHLYHVAAKDIPKEFGLKGASAGTENTIVVDIENTERLEIYRKLDLISSVEILKNLPPRKVRDVVDSCYKETFKAGEIIIKEGEKGSKFYIIAEGVAKVFTADKRYISLQLLNSNDLDYSVLKDTLKWETTLVRLLSLAKYEPQGNAHSNSFIYLKSAFRRLQMLRSTPSKRAISSSFSVEMFKRKRTISL